MSILDKLLGRGSKKESRPATEKVVKPQNSPARVIEVQKLIDELRSGSEIRKKDTPAEKEKNVAEAKQKASPVTITDISVLPKSVQKHVLKAVGAQKSTQAVKVEVLGGDKLSTMRAHLAKYGQSGVVVHPTGKLVVVSPNHPSWAQMNPYKGKSAPSRKERQPKSKAAKVSKPVETKSASVPAVSKTGSAVVIPAQVGGSGPKA